MSASYKHLTTFISSFLSLFFVVGCTSTKTHSNAAIDEALSLYRSCIDSGKAATYCDRYWDQRNEAIRATSSTLNCDNSAKVDEALSSYRSCINSNQTPSECDRYWDQRNAALADNSCASTASESNTKSNKATSGSGVNALIMGVLCSMSGNPSACMKGASDALTKDKADPSNTEERLRAMEEKNEKLEQRLRLQCSLKGGFYNPFTGCNK